VNPRISVILLTTLIGAGQGLFIAVFVVEIGALFALLPPPREPWFYFYGSLLAFMFTAAGLVASIFHLGRPGRAWRSAAQWRTSWLSREVLVLPAFMGVVLLYAVAHFLHWNDQFALLPPGAATIVLGCAGSMLSLALFVCTGMIYACLPFLREWATPLTVLNYALLGLASGFTLAATHATIAAPPLVGFLAGAALLFTLAGFATRAASLLRNSRLRPKSTLQTAIGVRHPRIVQTSQGFTGDSFNTREFFHGRSAGSLRAVKWLFLVAAFAVPSVLLAAGMAGAPRAAIGAAFIVQYAGLLAERWYFFAQANHPQNLYYQATT